MKQIQSVTKFLFGGLLILVSISATSEVANAQAKPNPRVAQLINDSGYQVKSTGQGTWVLDLQGTHRPQIKMLLASGTDFVVLGVVVAQKSEMNVTAEMMFKLMKFNNDYDYVKIGFDQDDDLFLRAEHKIRLLDQTEFNEIIERVRKDADEVYGAVKPFLTRR